MRIFSVSIVIFLLVVSCNDGSTGNRDSSVADDSSTSEKSISEIEEQTERLQNATPSDKNVNHYVSLINSHINQIGENMHKADSLLNLLDSSSLEEHWQLSTDRIRLMYLCVIRDKDSAEVLTRHIYQENTPESLTQSEIEFSLYYHLTYIKAIKGECDSAKYYHALLNTTIEQDSSAFYEIQLEDVRWINSWLPEQCD